MAGQLTDSPSRPRTVRTLERAAETSTLRPHAGASTWKGRQTQWSAASAAGVRAGDKGLSLLHGLQPHPLRALRDTEHRHHRPRPCREPWRGIRARLRTTPGQHRGVCNTKMGRCSYISGPTHRTTWAVPPPASAPSGRLSDHAKTVRRPLFAQPPPAGLSIGAHGSDLGGLLMRESCAPPKFRRFKQTP